MLKKKKKILLISDNNVKINLMNITYYSLHSILLQKYCLKMIGRTNWRQNKNHVDGL